MDDDKVLSKLREILEEERDRVREEAEQRATFGGELLAVKNNIGVIDTRKLPEGSLLGFVDGGSIHELGYVIRNGDYQVVKLIQTPEKRELKLIVMENLISYDLQLDILDRYIGEELPRIYTSASIGNVNGLDKYQSIAAATALEIPDDHLLMVIGPPGTGKTEFISKAAETAYKKGMRVLIASHTNRAVDNAIEKLDTSIATRVGNPSRISSGAMNYSLERNVLNKLQVEEEDPEEVAEYYSKNSKKIEQEMLKTLNSTPIVGSTLIKSAIYPMNEQTFDLVFIDESSQALVSAALLAMQKGKRFVMVGDPYQLSPVLKFSKNPSQYSAFNFFYSLKPQAVWLRNHYRSNPGIIGFAAKFIYKKAIKPHESCKEVSLNIGSTNPVLSPQLPVVFLNVKGSEEGKGSKHNPREAEATAALCEELELHGIRASDIGVITPYVKQKELIYKKTDVEVNTIDGFQGREKDVIILSLTATKDLRFASDPRRLNVAITRARKKLIVLGNEKSFMIPQNKKLLVYKLYRYAGQNGAVIDANDA
ncbi:MAG: AAA domain-containing protein [Archaeoglobaceae archaeon]